MSSYSPKTNLIKSYVSHVKCLGIGHSVLVLALGNRSQFDVLCDIPHSNIKKYIPAFVGIQCSPDFLTNYGNKRGKRNREVHKTEGKMFLTFCKKNGIQLGQQL